MIFNKCLNTTLRICIVIILIYGPSINISLATTESVVDSYIIEADSDLLNFGTQYFGVTVSGESVIEASSNNIYLTPDDNITIRYNDDSGATGNFYLISDTTSVLSSNVSGTVTIYNSMITNGINNGGDGITNAGSVSGVTSLTASGTISSSSLSASSTSTLNGINNSNDGITNAGAVSGVTTLRAYPNNP